VLQCVAVLKVEYVLCVCVCVCVFVNERASQLGSTTLRNRIFKHNISLHAKKRSVSERMRVCVCQGM